MRLDRAMLVYNKDWLEMKRNWQIVGPIVIVPMIMTVILPLILFYVPSILGTSGFNVPQTLLDKLPPNLSQEIAGMEPLQSMIYIFAVYFFAPFFLLIPLMASSVLASDSFAGEKDRKTIEALLATPIEDSEMLLGKILVSFIPSILVTFLAFAAYAIVVNVSAFGLFGGRLLLPNLLWLILIFGVTPCVALAGIGITVIVSTRVKGFREAQQISALLVLPILLLIFGEIAGALFFGPAMLALLILVFGAVDIVVFWVGMKLFRREEIIAKHS